MRHYTKGIISIISFNSDSHSMSREHQHLHFPKDTKAEKGKADRQLDILV